MNEMNWPAVYPEIFLLLAACVVALVDLWSTDPKRRMTYWLTQGSLAVVALIYLILTSATAGILRLIEKRLRAGGMVQ